MATLFRIPISADTYLSPIPGLDKEDVFVVKKEFGYLKNILEQVNRVKDIVIIGGGFIGVEFADECRKTRDVTVSIVEMLPHGLQKRDSS